MEQNKHTPGLLTGYEVWDKGVATPAGGDMVSTMCKMLAAPIAI